MILGVGRLTPQKDFPTLIRAFARVRRQRPARLVIVGEGRPEARAALMRLAAELGCAEDVSLPGFTHNPFCYMAHAGVFVLSSLHEGLPGVLIQALACGAPVVSTDCPSGPREILEGGRYGRLVALGDDAAMAEAISATPVASGRPCRPDGAGPAVQRRAGGGPLSRAAADRRPRPHPHPRAAGRRASTGIAMTKARRAVGWLRRICPASAGPCRIVPVVRSFAGERSANGPRRMVPR